MSRVSILIPLPRSETTDALSSLPLDRHSPARHCNRRLLGGRSYSCVPCERDLGGPHGTGSSLVGKKNKKRNAAWQSLSAGRTDLAHQPPSGPIVFRLSSICDSHHEHRGCHSRHRSALRLQERHPEPGRRASGRHDLPRQAFRFAGHGRERGIGQLSPGRSYRTSAFSGQGKQLARRGNDDGIRAGAQGRPVDGEGPHGSKCGARCERAGSEQRASPGNFAGSTGRNAGSAARPSGSWRLPGSAAWASLRESRFERSAEVRSRQ
jgi:hypothetical protein